jgi:hypothetical protein
LVLWLKSGIAVDLKGLAMFGDFFAEAERRNKEKQEEFDRRVPDSVMPLPGDTVVLHSGLLGRGFMWERMEGVCVAVAEFSAKVRYKKSYDKEHTEEWVHPAVITDIVKQQVPADQQR